MLSWLSVFQFSTIYSVALSDSRCMYASEPSSSPWKFFFFFMSFILSAILLCSFFSHILLNNCFASLISSCWFVLVNSSPPTCWKNFRSLFWKVLFCLYCLTLFRHLLRLPFSPISFDLSRQVVLLEIFFRSFPLNVSRVFFSLALSLVVAVSLCVLQAKFPIQVLYFCSGSLGDHQFYHRLVLFLHKWAHLF